MCRSIKRLRPAAGSEDPPASALEVREAALQFVRKISGFRRPSSANAAAFDTAVEEIARASARLLETLRVPGDGTARHGTASVVE